MEKKRNFYFRTETVNNESVEVYLGQNSGKQLSEDLQNAKSEVLIISPYIDETKLNELINLKNRNINVRLAFSDLRKEQYKQILRMLIHQNKETNVKEKDRKLKLINLYQIVSIASLCVGIFLLIYNFFEKYKGGKLIGIYLISFGLFYAFYYFNKLKKLAEKIEIYKYHYSEKVNFKYLRATKDDNMFIHSKIFVIDRKIAYLGSINFTNKGFTSNFETRVRITQKSKVEELVEFLHNIFDDNISFNKHELWYLGKQAYTEEKY